MHEEGALRFDASVAPAEDYEADRHDDRGDGSSDGADKVKGVAPLPTAVEPFGTVIWACACSMFLNAFCFATMNGLAVLTLNIQFGCVLTLWFFLVPCNSATEPCLNLLY